MKIAVGSYEAKIKLPELLRQIKASKSFTIANRGEAIAGLVPSAEVKAKGEVAAAEKPKTFMLADPVRGLNIKKLVEEGSACFVTDNSVTMSAAPSLPVWLRGDGRGIFNQ